MLHKERPKSLLKSLFNGVLLVLVYYFKKHFKPCFLIVKTFCSTLNSWIGEFVFWCHEQVKRLEILAIVAFANAVGFASLFWLWSAFPPFLLYKLVDDELLGLYIVNEKWPLKVDRPDSCENINFHGWQVKLFEKASFLYMFCAFCLLAQYIYLLDILWGQPIKLIQVTSNSKLRENQWNDLLFFEIVPSHCFGASEASKIDCLKN